MSTDSGRVTTRVTQWVAAPANAVYRALLDPAAVQHWMVPDGMTSEVLRFDAQEGGEFAISLTYDDPSAVGKTEGATDTFAGRFAELSPGNSVVQAGGCPWASWPGWWSRAGMPEPW